MSKIFGVHVPSETKNLAINGAMDFWQRVESAVSTINTTATTNAYASDMFTYVSGGGSTHNYSIQQSTNVPSIAQSGFLSSFSANFTRITGLSTFAAGDFTTPFVYHVEGLDYERIHGKTVTVGFWVNASVAGVYSLTLRNAGGSRSYVTTFTVLGANAWQFVAITVTLDNINASWVFTNSDSLQIYIGTVAGTSFQASSTNQWVAGNFVFPAGGANWQATSGATLNIAQFSITEGSLGVGPQGFQRAGKVYAQELQLCQRYYEKSYDVGTVLGTNAPGGAADFRVRNSSPTNAFGNATFKAAKRVSPTLSFWNSQTGAANQAYSEDNGGAYAAASAYWNTTCINRIDASGASAGWTIEFHWAAEAGL